MSLDSKTKKKLDGLVGMLGMLESAIGELKTHRENFLYLRKENEAIKILISEMLDKLIKKNIALEQKVMKLKNDKNKGRKK